MGVMTLLQLKYIVKIVECGSMNEASHELYVSQPTLSSSVKELENELGIEIFTRSSQGIALTVDGAEFLTYARQVLDQASLLEERYKNAKPRKQNIHGRKADCAAAGVPVLLWHSVLRGAYPAGQRDGRDSAPRKASMRQEKWQSQKAPAAGAQARIQ